MDADDKDVDEFIALLPTDLQSQISNDIQEIWAYANHYDLSMSETMDAISDYLKKTLGEDSDPYIITDENTGDVIVEYTYWPKDATT